MTKDDIFKEVEKMIREEVVNAENLVIHPNDRLREDIGADSLDFVEFWLWAEDITGKAIAEDEIKNLCTVEEVVNYIYDKQDKI